MSLKPIAIIMGSQSDWATMEHAAQTLDALDIGYETLIVSAHRTPDRLYEFAKNAQTTKNAQEPPRAPSLPKPPKAVFSDPAPKIGF